jgi:hypothetical protein
MSLVLEFFWLKFGEEKSLHIFELPDNTSRPSKALHMGRIPAVQDIFQAWPSVSRKQ